MLEKVTERIPSAFERAKVMRPCSIGAAGICCRFCFMGPCRVMEDREELSRGVCGATAASVAAKNFARMVAAGAAAHSDHGREVVLLFLAAAQGKAPGFSVKDNRKLRALAQSMGIATEGKEDEEIAIALGERLLQDFGQQEGEITFIRRAPQKRQELWRKMGIVPRGIDREIVEMLHRTSIGVDQDPHNILLHAARTALADGWGGSMIATELQDILFGTPEPLLAKVDLGVLKEDQVNIIVHGHEPLLPELIIKVIEEPEMLALARENGAMGINLAGICCTANEILMRHGIPIAGSFLHQELAIMTGAVEAMVVDVQCVMPSLPTVASCFHTEIITTSDKAKIPGAVHISFNHRENPEEAAREIVRRAILNFRNRGEVNIPKHSVDLVAGFSHEAVVYIQGGRYRGGYRPLNDAIIDGRIRGVVGVVGCNNPRVDAWEVHVALIKELIAKDVLVLTTGCGAISAARAELLVPEAAEIAGPGLREVCEAVGMPPVLHMGACVDNSRLLIAGTAMVHEGGLGEDLSDIPAAGCAPEWMSEKAVAIGHYFVASGIPVVFGVGFPTTGSRETTEFLFRDIERLTKGKWAFAREPEEMAKILISWLDERRKALKLKEVK